MSQPCNNLTRPASAGAPPTEWFFVALACDLDLDRIRFGGVP